jgi:hypothetical protein
MGTIFIIVLLILLLGGGGGYYGYRQYGGAGLGGALGLVLIILLVLWLFGGHAYQRLIRPPSKVDHSSVAYPLSLLYFVTSVCHRTDEAAIIA